MNPPNQSHADQLRSKVEEAYALWQKEWNRIHDLRSVGFGPMPEYPPLAPAILAAVASVPHPDTDKANAYFMAYAEVREIIAEELNLGLTPKEPYEVRNALRAALTAANERADRAEADRDKYLAIASERFHRNPAGESHEEIRATVSQLQQQLREARDLLYWASKGVVPDSSIRTDIDAFLATPSAPPSAAPGDAPAFSDDWAKKADSILSEALASVTEGGKNRGIRMVRELLKHAPAAAMKGEEDKERLDWLERDCHAIETDAMRSAVIRATDGKYFFGDSLRRAIDAARSASSTEAGEGETK